LKQTVRVCAVVEVPYVEIVPGLRSFGELAAKFALNAISTYAHVAIGKVYKNRMIGTDCRFLIRVASHTTRITRSRT
jgi:N-acetylmuramic acid 6-phosphate (MurNAc-6-P) etherase